jgi:hypothetical protein
LKSSHLYLLSADADVVVAQGESDAAALSPEAPLLRQVRADADDVERLLPRAIGERAAVSHALEARLQVEARRLIGAGRGSAAFEQVRGEEADRRLERGAGDVGAGGLLHRGRYRSLGECNAGEQQSRDRDTGSPQQSFEHSPHLSTPSGTVARPQGPATTAQGPLPVAIRALTARVCASTIATSPEGPFGL